MRWVVWVTALVACAPPTEAEFPEAWAKVVCSREKECDRGQFDSNWEDMDDCRTSRADAADQLLDIWDVFGNYSEDAAGECLSDMRAASCEEVENGSFDDRCSDVYQ